MQKEIIKNIYEKIVKKEKGCNYYKMDLHVHSPASKCYKRISDSIDEEYINILDKAIENDISIIAITDHNSVRGYFEMIELIHKSKVLINKYARLLILPGVEISNFGKHILAIFPPDKTKAELDNFLFNFGIAVDEQGDEASDAYKVTPVELLSAIHRAGGIAILAHADASNGMLEKLLHSTADNYEMWLQKGKSLTAIIKSEFLSAISLNDKSLKRKLEKDILNNTQYRRDRSIAVVYASDSHSTSDKLTKSDGQPIGSRYSVVKLSELNFHGLKLALQDSEVRIFEDIPQSNYPFIIGVAVKGGYLGKVNDWQYFRMNEALNCVIGARGTGKSTLLDIIQYTLFPQRHEDEVVKRFDSSVVFLDMNTDVYAFVCEPRIVEDGYTGDITNIKKAPSIYKRSKLGNFYNSQRSNEIYNALKSFSSVAYKQRDIFNYAQDENGPLNIINNLLIISDKEKYSEIIQSINDKTNSMQSRLDKIKYRDWSDYLETSYIIPDEDIEQINALFEQIVSLKRETNRLRLEVLDKVNRILSGQVKLSVKRTLGKKEYSMLTYDIIKKCRREFNITYEKEKWLKDTLQYIMDKMLNTTGLEWNLPVAILNNDVEGLAKNSLINIETAKQLMTLIRPCFDKELITIFPEDRIEFQYNVSSGISNKERFLPRNMLSMGQKAVAMLLIILTAGHDLGDNRPLIIDQPEDDLDNIYIYSSLVKEFRRIKNSRQLIFATHNANIPISGDAENIIILESSGESGYVSCSGSIDKVSISEKVLNILEGGREALDLRSMKYPPFQK